jgi:hypothetical protein
MSPPTTPAAHSTIPYSPDMHFPARHPFQRIPAVTIHLPLLPTVSTSAASASASVATSAVSTAVSATVHCRSFSITGSGIDQKFLEVIPIVLETHVVSFEHASLVRYLYYILCQY